MQELLLNKELVIYTGLNLVLVILILRLFARLIAAENETQALQNIIGSLLSKYSNREQILAKYIYDTRLGIYKHKLKDLFYCHKCLTEKTMESPLQTKKNGWFCPLCRSFYKKPADEFPSEE